VIRCIVNDVLAALDGEFAKIYADSGRPSIPPERLLRALLLEAFYTIRSETQLMERSSTTTCCTAGSLGSGSTSRYGCRRYSRRTANGALMARPPRPQIRSFAFLQPGLALQRRDWLAGAGGFGPS
jgi:transposase-like protein DUF772